MKKKSVNQMKELAATVIVFKRFGIVTVKKTVMMGRMKMIAVRKN